MNLRDFLAFFPFFPFSKNLGTNNLSAGTSISNKNIIYLILIIFIYIAQIGEFNINYTINSEN